MKVLDDATKRVYFECDECFKRRLAEHLPNGWIPMTVKGKERTFCCWKHVTDWMEVNG